MNIHTVVWVASAEDELIDLWLSAHDRKQITEAVHRIDMALRHHGPHAGIEITEGLFPMESPPLRALFEVVSADAIIRLLKIKRA